MQDTVTLSRNIRSDALKMVWQSKASHIGSSLSAADMLAVLYGKIMRTDPSRPDWPDRDRFILSKGHGAAAYYATLAECGFFPKGWLGAYCHNGSVLSGHVTRHGVPGVELSTGSLGHGLPVGCGMALAAKHDGLSWRTIVMLSDGECDEGSTWEAALFAGHHCLDNLLAIVDFNRIQGFGSVKEVLDLDPLADKWRAFRWAVREIDGHDHAQIEKALCTAPYEPGKPTVVVAHTVKGKGVSFMEDKLEWHYKSPTDEQLRQALRELTP